MPGLSWNSPGDCLTWLKEAIPNRPAVRRVQRAEEGQMSTQKLRSTERLKLAADGRPEGQGRSSEPAFLGLIFLGSRSWAPECLN